MEKVQKEYTPWRRFLAWVGFITIITVVVGIVAFLVWAHQYLAAAGY